MKKLTTLLFSILVSFNSYAEDNWTVDDNNWVYVNGNTVHGHKFGFAKDNGRRCEINMLFISWSTFYSGIEKYKGEDVKVFMEFDGKSTYTILELAHTYIFDDMMTLAMFTNTVMPEEFLDIIRNSKHLVVTFSSKNDMTNTLDIQSDIFYIEGFSDKFDKAQSNCRKE